MEQSPWKRPPPSVLVLQPDRHTLQLEGQIWPAVCFFANQVLLDTRFTYRLWPPHAPKQS